MLLEEATVEDIANELTHRLSITFVLSYEDKETGITHMHSNGFASECLALVAELLDFIEENMNDELKHPKERYKELKEKTEEDEDEE